MPKQALDAQFNFCVQVLNDSVLNNTSIGIVWIIGIICPGDLHLWYIFKSLSGFMILLTITWKFRTNLQNIRRRVFLE